MSMSINRKKKNSSTIGVYLPFHNYPGSARIVDLLLLGAAPFGRRRGLGRLRATRVRAAGSTTLVEVWHVWHVVEDVLELRVHAIARITIAVAAPPAGKQAPAGLHIVVMRAACRASHRQSGFSMSSARPK